MISVLVILPLLPPSLSSFIFFFPGCFMHSDHSYCPLHGGNQISVTHLDQCPLSHLVVGNLHNVTSLTGQRIFMI